MSEVLYGTDKLAPVQGSRGTGILFLTKPKPRSPFVYMGLGISTEKRGFYDNSFRVKIVSTPPCKNRKQKVGSSLSSRLLLWAPPQVERGGCM